MGKIIGKHTLELNYPGDGSKFLNFFDYMHGNDVIAEIKQGKLFYRNTEGEVELTFEQFLEKVEYSISQRKD